MPTIAIKAKLPNVTTIWCAASSTAPIHPIMIDDSAKADTSSTICTDMGRPTDSSCRVRLQPCAAQVKKRR